MKPQPFNTSLALIALAFLVLTVVLDTVAGHTMLGKVACAASLLNTLGFAILALPSTPDKKD